MRSVRLIPWWLACLLAALLTLLAACSDSPPPAPTIGVQPTDTAAAAGSSATFSVGASGPDIAYQWQVSSDGGASWSNVTGATSASYTTGTLTIADNGKRVRVVVSAAGISVNSSAVTLTVTAAVVAPAITVAPAAATVTEPANAVFSVTATGTALGYQWARSTDSGATWIDIAGATAASYDTGATTVSMNGQRVRVVVANSAGSVTSGAATLTVNAAPAAPAFTTQPASQSVTAGSAAAFTVAVTGTPAPALQWQRSTNGGGAYTDIAGATDPTYNTGATVLSQDGERYRVLASSSAGSATSSAATLTVNPAPQAPLITTQPVAQTVTAPATATFTAAATGVPTPTWQWQVSSDNVSFANINGATSASYSTPATTLADSGKYYRAVATNASGSANTNAVQLTVVTLTATWGTPSTLSNGDAYEPATAFNAGVADLAWSQGSALYAVRGTAAGGWGTAAPINGSLLNPYGVRLASSNGRAVAAWNYGSGRVAAAVSTASVWGAPLRLDTSSTGFSEGVEAAIDAQGRAVVVWSQSIAGTYQMMGSLYNGTTWSAPVQLLPGSGCGLPSVSVNAAGQGLVLFSCNGASQLQAVPLDLGVGFGSAQQLPSSTSLGRIRVAVDSSGNAWAAWTQGSTDEVRVARYTVAGGWAASSNLETGVTLSTNCPLTMAGGAGGHVLIAWCSRSGGPSDVVYARRYSPSSGWAARDTMSAAGRSYAMRPAAAANDGGRFSLVWIQNAADGAREEAAASLFDGTAWTAPTVLQSSNQTLENTNLATAIDATADAVAAWVEYASSGPRPVRAAFGR